jgi:hypothetical protein
MSRRDVVREDVEGTTGCAGWDQRIEFVGIDLTKLIAKDENKGLR